MCTLHIRSKVGDADALTQTLVVKPAAPAVVKLLTWESGCRFGCTSVILKCGAVVKALCSQGLTIMLFHTCVLCTYVEAWLG